MSNVAEEFGSAGGIGTEVLLGLGTARALSCACLPAEALAQAGEGAGLVHREWSRRFTAAATGSFLADFFLGAALLACLLGTAQAAESVVPKNVQSGFRERVPQPASSTNTLGGAREEKLRLKLNSLPRTVHGDIQISTIVVVAESNKFSFLPPHGWQVESDSRQKRIQLFRVANGSRITVDVIEEGASPKVSAEILSHRMLARFPGAKVADELQLSALGAVGPAQDLDWRAPSGASRRTRTGLIPFPGGHLEFALTSSPDSAVLDCQSLNQFLLSLRRAALGGSLDLPIVTPE